MTTGDSGRADTLTCPLYGTVACEVAQPSMERCLACDRYADLLRSVRALYDDRAWAVTPEGVLQEVG
ncbi:MAG TPA: hypothetical protein VLH79_12855 [Chthonomonadales bacterium]|nr:hypothetical protein [Chthonomonadales bacterium]